MKIGFDFHNVLDGYPNQIGNLIMHLARHNEIHIISAIGPRRVGTIEPMVQAFIGKQPNVTVHEVIFRHPRQSPYLKTAKAQELKLQMFFDDRADVCDAMNEAGILCFRVPRPVDITDEESDKEM